MKSKNEVEMKLKGKMAERVGERLKKHPIASSATVAACLAAIGFGNRVPGWQAH